ncbi:transcriptional repressor of sporulation and degradative enzyme production [Marinomonas sp. MED121]|uniref:FMN-binding negative transcriptional regulator n=1 Tax=Marinomonas sp. MED121 TaxID=314277 RepID=UPI000068FDAF|nr:FMN-binding negative transcriptional regulator [Marinomonas sp. MED121]EAQ65502.1 transcriptional repressor of sporulation and degradative enzyme production [Marinomonas sp. MED121]
MYTPKNLAMEDTAQIHAFIKAHSFGVLIFDTAAKNNEKAHETNLNGTHLPFLLDEKQNLLYSHMARANPHWKSLEGTEVLIIFSGPHAYISPTWYAHSPAVPTWNYAAVHAYGKVSLLNDDDTLSVIDDKLKTYKPSLLKTNEEGIKEPVTDEFKHKLLSAIVGFKIEITKLEGKLKLGQHRPKADQEGVYKALSESPRLDDQALALYMEKMAIGCG